MAELGVSMEDPFLSLVVQKLSNPNILLILSNINQHRTKAGAGFL